MNLGLNIQMWHQLNYLGNSTSHQYKILLTRWICVLFVTRYLVILDP